MATALTNALVTAALVIAATATPVAAATPAPLPASLPEVAPAVAEVDVPEVVDEVPVDGKRCVDNLAGLAGASRHDTIARVMVHLAQGRFVPPYTFVARDDNYHDVLAAIPYAVRANVPIAITSKDVLNPHTRRYLLDHRRGTRIVIVGGTGAVSLNVERQLRALGFEVDRIAGRDRAHTMELLAELSGMRPALIGNRQIHPVEVMGGAVYNYTPVARRASLLMPKVPPGVCYRPGDVVASLYKRAHETVWTK